MIDLGDNCIQNFNLGWYIVGYTVRNLALKRDFQMYIQQYTSQNENFEYGYPHSIALLQFPLKLERCKWQKAPRHPMKCDVINDIKLFPTVYRRIYCSKFLTLSNQMSCYKIKRIRIFNLFQLFGIIFSCCLIRKIKEDKYIPREKQSSKKQLIKNKDAYA